MLMANTSTSAPVVDPERLSRAYSYAAYRQLIDELMARNRTTSPTQTEQLVRYAHLNIHRMRRLNKTIRLLPELQAALGQLPRPYVWLVLTEGWCGDAAQIVPVLEAIAQASHGQVTTRYLLRDENPDLMDRYLTNGGRAIPRLIVLRADTLTEAAAWGPRPKVAQELYTRLKNEQVPYEEFATQLHGWYAQDHTLSTQRELLALVQQLR